MRPPTALSAASILLAACGGAPPPPPPAPASMTTARPLAAAAAASASVDSTVRYDIIFADHIAGKSVVVHHPDGTYDEDYAFEDRGRGPKSHTRVELGRDLIPTKLEVTGTDYFHQEVHETASCDAARCKWDNENEHGEGGQGFYVPLHGGMVLDGPQLEAAKRAAGGALRLLPGGSLRVEQVAETTLTHGTERLHVVAWQTSGMGLTPSIEWFDDTGTPFATLSDWGATVREGWGDGAATLLALEHPLAQSRREKAAKAVSHHPERGIAVIHARLFDSITRAVREDTTILIEGGKVTAVGPSSKLTAKPGAEVIDAHGKTVIPGLWDMHVHADDDDGVLNVALGVTTVRDLGGGDGDATIARKARWNGGRELGPHMLLAGLVDGRGPFQGPTKVFADTEAEARAVVKELASKGYVQLKIYSSVKPEIVKVLVEEAKKSGLRVSGHTPAHMIAEDAVKTGFDELQHVNFLMLDLVGTRDDDTRTPLRFTLVADRGADLDLNSPRSKALFDLLAERKTVVDPTLAVFEGMFTARPESPSPILAPVLARLPVQVQRNAKGGGLPVPDGKDARYKASFEKCKALVKRLYDRKIPIVAGTDAIAGFSLHRELELYAEAGIPNAEVLSLATFGAARVMKAEGHTGDISPGKDADLVILDGDPLKRMSAIRNVVTVIKDGTVIDAVAAQATLSIAAP